MFLSLSIKRRRRVYFQDVNLNVCAGLEIASITRVCIAEQVTSMKNICTPGGFCADDAMQVVWRTKSIQDRQGSRERGELLPSPEVQKTNHQANNFKPKKHSYIQ